MVSCSAFGSMPMRVLSRSCRILGQGEAGPSRVGHALRSVRQPPHPACRYPSRGTHGLGLPQEVLTGSGSSGLRAHPAAQASGKNGLASQLPLRDEHRRPGWFGAVFGRAESVAVPSIAIRHSGRGAVGSVMVTPLAGSRGAAERLGIPSYWHASFRHSTMEFTEPAAGRLWPAIRSGTSAKSLCQ
jgi:hypothetical protein